MSSKTSFLIIILITLSTISKSQSWYSFFYKLPIDKYIGSQFKLEASVRTDIEDESASARIWLRINDSKGDMVFLENTWDKPIRSSKWGIYLIEGTINESAAYASFGSISQYSGVFYYDNFKLSIKRKDGTWEQIYKMDFENGLNGWHAGTSSNPDLAINSAFIATIENTNSQEHKHCLKIVGKNIPNYGANKKAGKYARVNGINLYYEIYGTGKPLVILHGNGGSITDAEQHIPFFKEKYQVIAIDSRGQGNSIDDTTTLTYDLMSSDVNELLEQLHIDSAYIWGHSDGAILSLILAMDYPKKVKKAIAYAANLTSDTLALTPVIYDEIVLKSKSQDLKERQLNMLMLNYPHISFADLHRIKAEILIMSGDNDDIPLSHSLEIYKNIKKSNLCVIPGATHYGAFRKPKLFQELAVDFFDKPFQK
jgi:pimeloyl-ACP methyl ester carboxylesterase